jgi:hypothetical protein
MAMVESVVTTTTARITSRSLSLVFGRTEAMASAADAPQTPTEPPERRPNSRLRPSSRASSAPTIRVVAMPTTTMPIGTTPSAAICSTVIRAPSRATPVLSTAFEANSIPGMQRPSSCRKWKVMPNRSANSMTGAL